MGVVSVLSAGGMMQRMGAVLILTMMMCGSAQPQQTADPECCVYRCLDDYFVGAVTTCLPDATGACEERLHRTAQTCVNSCPVLSSSTSSCGTQCLAASLPRYQGCVNSTALLVANCAAASSQKFISRCVSQGALSLDDCMGDSTEIEDNCVNACFRTPFLTLTPTGCQNLCLAAYYTGSPVCTRQATRSGPKACLERIQETTYVCRDNCSPSACPAVIDSGN